MSVCGSVYVAVDLYVYRCLCVRALATSRARSLNHTTNDFCLICLYIYMSVSVYFLDQIEPFRND